MEETKYTITLTDGTSIGDLTLNGNNYISKTSVQAETFVGNCSPMTVSDGETEEVHEFAELVQIKQYGNEYWMVFRDIPEHERKEVKVRADVDYLAMMTDVDLEEV